MAKSKKKTSARLPVSPPAATAATGSPLNQAAAPTPHSGLPDIMDLETHPPVPAIVIHNPKSWVGIRSYLALNAAFAAFCLFQYAVVRTTMSETKGLVFFFTLLVASFAIASVFDALHDCGTDVYSDET